MKKFFKLVAGLAILVSLSGCAAVLVGGLFYASAKTDEERQLFTNNFNERNIEREKEGLEPDKFPKLTMEISY